MSQAKKVLVIEDHSETGTLLTAYINDEMRRLVSVPNPLEVPHNRNGYRFHDSNDEPGGGQLVHLRDAVAYKERMHDQPVEHYPVAELYPLAELRELIAKAADCEPTFGYHLETDNPSCEPLREAVLLHEADILIVDLVLENAQGERMEREDVRGFATVDPGDRNSLLDPRPELRKLTGFKLLRAFAREMPVIITSSLTNPLVAQHCLVNGAFAYVPKPVRMKCENGFDFASVTKDPVQLDSIAKKGIDSLNVVVNHYLTCAAAEVMKAMTALELRSIFG